jgi:hypothetical protein
MGRTFLRSESSTRKRFAAARGPPVSPGAPTAPLTLDMLVHGPLRADCLADLEQSNGHPKNDLSNWACGRKFDGRAEQIGYEYWQYGRQVSGFVTNYGTVVVIVK